mmetsp:Transcript_10964/g.24551  ORF Transcript_10964/g.24551 Transcript_10964/m.24551 type:complete len:366 (+) Transcript_10964:341-1438(+)
MNMNMSTAAAAAPSQRPSETFTSDPTTWSVGRNTFVPKTAIALTSAHQLSADGIRLVVSTASNIRSKLLAASDDNNDKPSDIATNLRHKILSVVSYTPNPQSDASHLKAFAALGGSTLHVDASARGKSNMTSAKKGETLADTLSCMECYGDVAVLRHWDDGAVTEAVGRSSKALVLGGGSGHDVTAALGDLLVLIDGGYLGDGGGDAGADDAVPVSKDGGKTLVISIVGDCTDGNSPIDELLILLCKYMTSSAGSAPSVVNVRVCCPDGKGLDRDTVDFVRARDDGMFKLDEYRGDDDDDVEQFVKESIEMGGILYQCHGASVELPEAPEGMSILYGNGGKDDESNRQAQCRLNARMAIYKLLLA